ncbi:MAG: hypothetical protein WCR42_03320 [bacterium]
MRKLLFSIGVVFILNMALIFAQNLCPDPTLWTSETETYYLTDFDYSSQVDYKTGIVNTPSGNNRGVIIDWSTFNNQIPILRTTTIKKLLELDIVSKLIPQTPPDLSHTVYVYYESECKTTVSLWLNLVETPLEDCCDDGFPDPESAVNKELNAHTYRSKEITKQVSCGAKCCARVYTAYWHFDDMDHRYHFVLDDLTTVSITDCNSTTTFLDCDGNPLPCNSNCYDPNYEE